jgi:predicted lipoprotein
MMNRARYAGLLIVLGCLLGAVQGCKLVQNDPEAAKSGDSYSDDGFDAGKMVASMWQPKVVPSIEKRATDLATLRSAIGSDADAAGEKYGYRGNDPSAPWNFPTRLHGTIVSVDESSSQGTVGVDTTGSGKADVTVDIGPTVLGTTLRDSLDFVAFTDFKNQIDYAKFGTALNAYAVTHVLDKLPRSAMKGKTISVLGAFTNDGLSDTPEVVPLEVTLGSPS